MVAFLAVEDFVLNVVPFSHSVTQATELAEEGMSARELDEAMLGAMPSSGFRLKELHVQAGEVILMHGMCVHSGAAGKVGTGSIRCHWYIMEGGLVQQDGAVYTNPLLAWGRAIARMLGFPAGRNA